MFGPRDIKQQLPPLYLGAQQPFEMVAPWGTGRQI